MQTTNVITSDGPYLHVLLRDVVPPDWEELRQDLEPEINEGARHVTFALARTVRVTHRDPQLLKLVGALHDAGVESTILH